MSDRILNTSLDYLSSFTLVLRGIHRNICYISIQLIITFTQNFSLILNSQSTWKYNIQANKNITKIKEKWSIIQFDGFALCFIFFHSNVSDNKCHRQKWHVLFFTHIKLMAHVVACAHVSHTSNKKDCLPNLSKSLNFAYMIKLKVTLSYQP